MIIKFEIFVVDFILPVGIIPKMNRLFGYLTQNYPFSECHICIRTITHSRPKFKIILIKKVLLDTSQFYMVCQNSWMVLVFPIQIFWTLEVFTIQFFLTIVFWQVFCSFYSTNFEFLSGMLLPGNFNRSSSFYKGPQICKVWPIGSLDLCKNYYVLTFIFCGSVLLLQPMNKRGTQFTSKISIIEKIICLYS